MVWGQFARSSFEYVSIFVISSRKSRRQWIGAGRAAATVVWPDQPQRLLVGCPPADIFGARDVRRLFDVGGVPGRPLLFRAIPIPVLFSLTLRRPDGRPAWLVRHPYETWLVSRLDSLVGGVMDPMGTRRVSTHLLLLSRRILQSVLGR